MTEHDWDVKSVLTDHGVIVCPHDAYHALEAYEKKQKELREASQVDKAKLSRCKAMLEADDKDRENNKGQCRSCGMYGYGHEPDCERKKLLEEI